MYGSVLGASVTTGSIAVLPHTGGSALALTLAITTMTVGIGITVFTVSKIVAAKFFA